MKRKFYINVIPCGNGAEYFCSIVAKDDNEALNEGIKKIFGKKCSFFRNFSLNSDSEAKYGQVIEPSVTFGSNCITETVRIEVKEVTNYV